MNFNSVTIRNFRNFEDITISLTNKNILFGMNDVGKTNFLYALRFLFDKEIRRYSFSDTDYFQKNINEPIEILVVIDIADTENWDSQKLRAAVGAVLLSNQNKVFIQLKAHYDETEMVGQPVLYWGGDIENLEPMKAYGNSFELDRVFNTVYIDAYVDLYALFKKNAKLLMTNDNEADCDILKNINKTCDTLNNHISQLSGVKTFENRIAQEYSKYRHEDVSVTVKSEIAIKGVYSNVVPYIKRDNDSFLYPTSGEGRKKLLVYSIFDLLAKESAEKKVNLFLIEEPENHLHRSLQIGLSHVLFLEGKYPYLFMTTHSPYVLSEIDNVNLVRIYNRDKIVSKSVIYNVPENFKNQKNMLNKELVEAIFTDKVLLVEGPSEKVLFSKVLSVQNPYYEVDGVYILSVEGIGFHPYLEILKPLDIKCVIKTDNDLRKRDSDSKYSVLGFSRINNCLGRKMLPDTPVDNTGVDAKRLLYDENRTILDSIRKAELIHLSRCSLEEDLDEVIHDEMLEYLPEARGEVVKYLQGAKKKRMVQLVEKLTEQDCDKIYGHYNFECLKEVLE